jgi:hypothetical protein
MALPASVILLVHTTYEDGRQCSETSALKIRTPGNHPEESIQKKSLSLKQMFMDRVKYSARCFAYPALRLYAVRTKVQQ